MPMVNVVLDNRLADEMNRAYASTLCAERVLCSQFATVPAIPSSIQHQH